MSNPNPQAPSVDIINALEDMTVSEQAAWLSANFTKVKPADLGQVIAWASKNIDASGSPTPQGQDAVLSGAVSKAQHYLQLSTSPSRMNAAADKAVADSVAGKKVDWDLDGSGGGKPSDNAKTALDQSKIRYVAANPGTSIQGVETITTKAGAPPTTPTPNWILATMANQPGFGGDLTTIQKDRIVANWNETYGTSLTWLDLIKSPQFNDPTNETTNVVQSAISDNKPVITYNVALPNGKSVALTADKPGFINNRPIADVIKAVKYANTFGLVNDKGDVGWQPLNMLLQATGQLSTDSKRAELAKRVADLSAAPTMDANALTTGQMQEVDAATGKPTGKMVPAIGLQPGAVHSRGEMGDQKVLLSNAQKELADYDKAHPDGVKIGPVTLSVPGLSIAKTVQAYKDGLDRYGDPTMAYVYAQDPALASRLFASGGDILKVDDRDVTAAQSLLDKGGWDPQALANQGFDAGRGIKDFLDNMDQKAKAIKQKALDDLGPVQTFQDPETVRQSVKSLWNQMFLQDPSQAMTDAFAKEIHDMEAKATLQDASKGVNGQNVDVGAQIQRLVQNSPMYKQLYGNKGNMTDDQYRGQFQNAANQILGPTQVDNQSILSGMASGNAQTTTGAASVTGLATSNSQFLGNLASAAQVLNNMT